MSKQEDFRRPEKPLEKWRKIDNEARTSKKAEMKGKFNKNQTRITLWDIQLSSLIVLVYVSLIMQNIWKNYIIFEMAANPFSYAIH